MIRSAEGFDCDCIFGIFGGFFADLGRKLPERYWTLKTSVHRHSFNAWSVGKIVVNVAETEDISILAGIGAWNLI
jgi:hypothetical protein